MRALPVLAAAIALTLLTVPASAQQFVVDTGRLAPYKNYKFRVKWDGKYVPGIYKVSALHRKTRVIRNRGGGGSATVRSSPGSTQYEPIVLVRGRSHDPSFEQWANKVHNYGGGGGAEVSLRDYRKDIVIDVMNEAGQLALSFQAYRCWPSEYVPIGPLDARNPATLTEKLVLQCEGIERDDAVTEPTPPSFTEPEN